MRFCASAKEATTLTAGVVVEVVMVVVEAIPDGFATGEPASEASGPVGRQGSQ